ncbi:MAG: ABC transporter permease [Thermoanaerobaculaceae bacterium]
MGPGDLLRFALGALAGHRLRSALSALGVAIGVLAVMLLTSLGEGTRQYIVGQFTQFGTSLIGVQQGSTKTFGFPGVFGGTTEPLTIADAESLERLPGVERVVPVVLGQALVEHGGRGRSVVIYGVNHEAAAAFRIGVAQGSFLPVMEARRRASVAVLGPRLGRELFGDDPPLGRRVRVGGESFLVIGVMEPKGQVLGFDLDDLAWIPVANAQDLFNQANLLEIDVVARNAAGVPGVVEAIRRTLAARHRGEEDFSIVTQTEMLDTFGRVISIITATVSAIAGISLFVGAMGILTIMWIAVRERTAEIGMLRALGVSAATVGWLFLLEATCLAVAGALAGVAVGAVLEAVARWLVPGLPLATPPGAVLAALAMSLLVGAASGVLPARQAACLDPVDALRAE